MTGFIKPDAVSRARRFGGTKSLAYADINARWLDIDDES
jgi:hypothetical protein